ncbi:MAG: hypothetical protein HY701_09045 [Gemmatimonadetes bacterium]|nr:hypothetical protein [Gemmatimonadota bacterium]
MAVGSDHRQRTPRRRRVAASDPLRKTGWQVRQSVVDAVKEAVQEGAAESQNAFVEQAITAALQELRRKRVYEAYARAASDPAFMKQMRSVTEAFEPASGDGLSRPE